MKIKFWQIVAVLMVAAMILAACGPKETPIVVPTEAKEPVETAAEGTFLERAFAGEFKGTVVTMAGPFTDNDAVKFDASIKEFEDKTGIDIQYTGSKEFEASIGISIEGGNPPDIVDFPQPGLLSTFVKKGYVLDVMDWMTVDQLKKNYIQSWLDMAMMEGQDGEIMAGIWGRVNGKSLVWYPKKAFDEAGYTVPTTWEELLALSEQIKSDGDTPWCVGIESGAATGWPMTDWIEEMMLRTTSLENYDKWVKGELKFDSPEVRKAVDTVGKIWFTDGYVYGGRQAIATTFFGDAPKPMFDDPPKCWLHKQGNFITTFFPEGLEPGVDYSFFYLPPVDTAYGKPVLVAGDIYSAFADRPEVKAVMEYFATGESVKAWVQSGGAISPHLDSSLDWYTNVVDRGVAEIILNATSVRFDGSDLMPGAVGAGSFWKSMTSYVSGSISEDTALKEIDASWPVEGVTPPKAEETFLDKAFAGEYKDTVVTMAGPFTDNDAVKFDASIKEFEDKTGIDIQYTGSKEFEASIGISIEGGNPPDIVDFPQPGLLSTFVKKGYVLDVMDWMTVDQLKKNYIQSWLDMAMMEGQDGEIMAGIWGRVNGKSLVWYPKKAFDEAGYTVPTTWEELLALSEQIKSDGDTPWCVGIESGAATGWPMTDWIEEMMLRTTSLENYDKWVKGELKFDSPEVRKAVDTVGKIWFTDGYVYGGRQAIATTFFGDAPKPMFDDPPKCWLHKQGNFITTFFPEGLEPGVDYSFFYLPPVDTAYGKPVLVAGDIYSAFADRPEVKAVMEYFATGESVKAWVQSGGAISPHLDSSLDWYTNVVDRGVAEIILNATSVRFDGSDLMPGAVGAGSFWKSMTSYVSGSIDLDTALKEIDASWPK